MEGMKYGYARVSTKDHPPALQLAAWQDAATDALQENQSPQRKSEMRTPRFGFTKTPSGRCHGRKRTPDAPPGGMFLRDPRRLIRLLRQVFQGGARHHPPLRSRSEPSVRDGWASWRLVGGRVRTEVGCLSTNEF